MPKSADPGPEITGWPPDEVLAPASGMPGTRPEVGDARLVEQARHGDDDAFATLVGRYERKLLAVLVRMVHDPELARDLAQETFWKVYSRLDRFDTSRRFGPWLFRIGVNLALDELRRRPAIPAASLSIDRPVGADRGGYDLPDPDPRIREELAQEVHFLLDKLPLPYRTVLVLRDLEGFSSAEVAAIIQKREATVRWRLARGREMFRELWERREATDRPRRVDTTRKEEGGHET